MKNNMLSFKEKYGSIYLMDDNDTAIYELTNPAILFDSQSFTLLKIGNKKMVEDYFNDSIAKCKKVNSDLFETWFLMDVHKDIEELNKLLQNTGYVEVFLKTYMNDFYKQINA